MKTNNRTVIGRRRGYGRLLLKKTWFEISEIPRAHWNGTFRLHRPDISHRVFGYCSCKQDKKERHWGQQFWQRALSRLVKISGISGSAVNGTRFVDSSHWKIPRKSGKFRPKWPDRSKGITFKAGPEYSGRNQPTFPEFWVEWKAPYK